MKVYLEGAVPSKERLVKTSTYGQPAPELTHLCTAGHLPRVDSEPEIARLLVEFLSAILLHLNSLTGADGRQALCKHYSGDDVHFLAVCCDWAEPPAPVDTNGGRSDSLG